MGSQQQECKGSQQQGIESRMMPINYINDGPFTFVPLTSRPQAKEMVIT